MVAQAEQVQVAQVQQESVDQNAVVVNEIRGSTPINPRRVQGARGALFRARAPNEVNPRIHANRDRR